MAAIYVITLSKNPPSFKFKFNLTSEIVPLSSSCLDFPIRDSDRRLAMPLSSRHWASDPLVSMSLRPPPKNSLLKHWQTEPPHWQSFPPSRLEDIKSNLIDASALDPDGSDSNVQSSIAEEIEIRGTECGKNKTVRRITVYFYD
jgi:hypothetical protein